jgi:hypothetical protein
MKRFLLLTISVLIGFSLFAQFEISSLETEYYDEARSRWIETHVYYPSVIDDGTTETFPFIVVGHGFAMNQSHYSYLWNYFVPKGYILVMVNTETGTIFPPPDHGDFGNDIGFLAGYFYENSLDAASTFYNNVEPFPAIMGHSMGGGSTHLASANYTEDIGIVLSLAANETDPSAIEAAANADLPIYIFYGEFDEVSPPDENQIPIYDNSNSSCKTLINVLGGGHCYFADDGSLCDIADSSPYEIEREEQLDVTLDFLDMIFDYELRGNTAAYDNLVDSLSNSPRIEYLSNCISQTTEYTISASANPSAGGSVSGVGTYAENASCTLTATPNSGYEFINWTESGSEVSTNASYTFTVTGDRTLVANFDDLVGMDAKSITSVSIYPNPAQDLITIEANEITDIQIIDLTGKTLINESVNSNQININVSNLASGFYQVIVNSKAGKTTEKIQINK